MTVIATPGQVVGNVRRDRCAPRSGQALDVDRAWATRVFARGGRRGTDDGRPLGAESSQSEGPVERFGQRPEPDRSANSPEQSCDDSTGSRNRRATGTRGRDRDTARVRPAGAHSAGKTHPI